MKTRKRLGKDTTTDDKDQADLKGVTNDEILTKKEGSNGKNVNTIVRLYDERDQSMVDRMATMVRVERTNVLKMERQS